MNIDSIKDGVVIDHIGAGCGMRLYELMGLEKLNCSVAIIMNISSKKLGKKDIIKIDADIPVNYDLIGYAAPGATVNIIKNEKVYEKKTLDLPETLVNVIRCRNPRCITSTEQEIEHIFKLSDRGNRIYRCCYCETEEHA